MIATLEQERVMLQQLYMATKGNMARSGWGELAAQVAALPAAARQVAPGQWVAPENKGRMAAGGWKRG